MKTKALLIVAATLLAIGVAIHIGHEPPKDGNCPLQFPVTEKR